MSTLILLLACAVNYTVCIFRVKRERDRAKELVIKELREKYARSSYYQRDEVTPFVMRPFWREFYAYVGDVWVKWIIF